MGRDSIANASKKLSWLLRHGAEEAGVAMDAAGWVAVTGVAIGGTAACSCGLNGVTCGAWVAHLLTPRPPVGATFFFVFEVVDIGLAA